MQKHNSNRIFNGVLWVYLFVELFAPLTLIVFAGFSPLYVRPNFNLEVWLYIAVLVLSLLAFTLIPHRAVFVQKHSFLEKKNTMLFLIAGHTCVLLAF